MLKNKIKICYCSAFDRSDYTSFSTCDTRTCIGFESWFRELMELVWNCIINLHTSCCDRIFIKRTENG